MLAQPQGDTSWVCQSPIIPGDTVRSPVKCHPLFRGQYQRPQGTALGRGLWGVLPPHPGGNSSSLCPPHRTTKVSVSLCCPSP